MGRKEKQKEAKELAQDRNNLLGEEERGERREKEGGRERERERDRDTSWTKERRGGRISKREGFKACKCGLSWYVQAAISCLVLINLTCREAERNVFCTKEH